MLPHRLRLWKGTIPSMRREAVFAATVLSLFGVLSATAGTRTVTLNKLVIGINDVSGGIVALEYPGVGRILATEPEAASLVDLAFPVAEYVPMRLGTKHSRVEITELPDRVTLTWNALAPSRTDIPLPAGTAKTTVTLSAAPDGRSVILKCRIENSFPHPIPQVLFPDFVGLRAIGAPETTELTLARGSVSPFTQRAQSRHGAAFWPVDSGWQIYEATAYSYGPNVMNWLDYGSLQGGFSLFQKKWRDRDYRRPDILTYVSESQPDRCRLTCWQPGRVESGKTWESPDYVMTPHAGGWAKGIETYRAYVASVNPPHEIPKHIREGLGSLSLWLSDSQETVTERATMRYKDIPGYARDVKAHGLDELSLWRWCFHLRLPIPHRPVLGTPEEWIDAIKQSRAMGVNVSGALGIHLLHHTQLARYGVTYAQRNAWNYHRDLIPNFNPSYLRGLPFDHAGQTVPPSIPQWREDVHQALTEWIDRGLTSFTWDVYGGGGPDGALSSRYEDSAALNEVVKRFMDYARSKDPQATFNAETNSVSGLEWDGEVIDYTWNWISNQVKEGHLTTTTYLEYIVATPIMNVLRSPRLNTMVENSPVALRKAFADGLYIIFLLRKPDGENGSAVLSEKPHLSPLVKQAVARRKQFLPHFADGVPIGNCLLATASPLFVRSYVRNGTALTVIVNESDRPLSSELRLNASLWLKEGALRARRYDADGRQVSDTPVTVAPSRQIVLPRRELPAGEMEFFVIE